ncbi:MAG: N-acetyl-alpha-D-glucosaminyl L-malate synthase BshA [Candidatus Thorarchaeota archaeon]|nr:MAG: N-acetyl-alpha-D-glucosaminyl L-malate synthase BshA [Candidatus Thorarchaeota archaeon]
MGERMRIGVNLYPGVGGSGYLATRLGQSLAKRGHQIHFISYERPFSLMWEQTSGVYVDLVDRFDYPLFKTIGPPYTMALTSKIIKVAHDAKLDVVHSHYAIPHAMSAYMAREICGIPYAVTLHGSDVHTLGLDPAYRPVVKHAVENADAVTCVSEFLKKKAKEELGIERDIEVIPNFIDIERFSHLNGIRLTVESGCVSLRKTEDLQEIKPDEMILLHASNFRRVKRVVGLVEIMRIVVDHLPNTRLIIAGDGPTRIEVERKIEELDLCNNVHLLGIKSNMQEIMCSADVFLLNSTLEGMPLTLLEAMSCSLPVVTTPAGGIPELVRPGIDGIVTKGFEQDEFAEAIIDLLENEKLRKEIAASGRKRVETSFSAEQIVSKYERVLESVRK